MKIDLQRHGTVTVVVPQDALTESTVAELRTALEREGLQHNVRLVLDLAQVAYVDSAGIEFLLGFCGNPPLQQIPRREAASKAAATPGVLPAARAAGAETAVKATRPRESQAGGLRPRLAGLNDTVREALYLTDALKRFSIFDSVPAAVRSYV
jgi:anti-anti-sigma regulatory factor